MYSATADIVSNKPGIKVVHQVPGRIRIKLPEIGRYPLPKEFLSTNLSEYPGIKSFRLNISCSSLIIEYDPQVQDSQKILLRVRNLPFPLIKTSTNATISFGIGSLGYVCAAGLGLLASSTGLLPPLSAASALIVIAIPIGLRAINNLYRHHLSVDALDFSAIFLSALQGNIVPGFFIAFLVGTGEYIRELTAYHGNKAVSFLMLPTGYQVYILHNGKKELASIEKIQLGDVIVVYTGGLIPVDGQVIEGVASVDRQSLTGESSPVYTHTGDNVYAMTYISEGKLYIRTTAIGTSTRAGQIASMLDGNLQKTHTEDYTLRLAEKLVGPSFLLAGAIGLITRDMSRTVSVLVVDFATGLRVSIPTTILAMLIRSSRDGVLFKDGMSLEKLAKVDIVVFDKTGTLTLGQPQISHVKTMNGYSERELLSFAASVESRYKHPAGKSIVFAAHKFGIPIPERESSEYMVGMGVSGEVFGRKICVGSKRFMEYCSVQMYKLRDEMIPKHGSEIFISIDGELAGMFIYEDSLREESVEVISTLHNIGIKQVIMLTGDHYFSAEYVARQLGISSVKAELFPDDKAKIVNQLREQGHIVAVVGDGINDSPALAAADVAISIKHGADIARDISDVLLLDKGLVRLPDAFKYAQNCMGLVRQNIGVVIVPNLLALILSFASNSNVVTSTLLNNGSTILAALNGLRPLSKNYFRK